jgi:hypothetical protein
MPRQSGFPKVSGSSYVGNRSGITKSGDLETREIVDLPADIQRLRDFRESEISEPVKIFDPMDAFLPEVSPRKSARILAAQPLDYRPALEGQPGWRKPGIRFQPHKP